MLTIDAKKQTIRASFDPKQFALLIQCSEKHDMREWNEWRKMNPEQPVLLRTANLAKAYLRGADLHKADLRGANLRGADLSGAKDPDFRRVWADLSGADLTDADLCGTDFRGANLSDANFHLAYLFYTNLSWTNLSRANFSGADLWAMLYEATLTSVDLNQATRRFLDITKAGTTYSMKQKHFSTRLVVLSPGSAAGKAPERQETLATTSSEALRRAA
nr:pentapeptide repeat-containing protein [uncultured Desulfobulbus sp.]